MNQQDTQENSSVTVKEVRQTGNDHLKRGILGSTEGTEDARNLHCYAEPKQIQGENMKLSQIRETMEQNLEG